MMGLDLTGFGAVADSATKILGMFFPDKTEEEKAKMAQAFAIMQMQQEAANKQVDVNIEEAKNPGPHFRDGAGWVCVAGLAVMVFKPLVEWVLLLLNHPINLPQLDLSSTQTMLWALLGLGGMHAAPDVLAAARGPGTVAPTTKG